MTRTIFARTRAIIIFSISIIPTQHIGDTSAVKILFIVNSYPLRLSPDQIYDASGGCFSGIEKDDKLYLMYKGHVDLPIISHEGADRIESQNIAVSSDGVHFEKIAENPVIYTPKHKEVSQSDVRDPKAWEHNGKYYALVGSRTPTADPAGTIAKGQIVIYESDDLINWTFKNIMPAPKAIKVLCGNAPTSRRLTQKILSTLNCAAAAVKKLF